MENIIKYYYNINAKDLKYIDNHYEFYLNNILYYFTPVDIINEKELLSLKEININNKLAHNIVFNRFNKLLSNYNGINYILMEIYINPKKKIQLREIEYIANTIMINSKENNINWGWLWSKKIDYLEMQINEIGKKYPILVNTFSFFVGLCENAISYFNNNVKKEDTSLVLSHNKIKPNDTIISLYDPLNTKLDHKARDLSEYIKLSFFQNNKYIFKELNDYFKRNFYSKNDMYILFSRILYPSFYFDLYDNIIIGNINEEDIIYVTNNIDEYINYLYNVYLYLNNYYNLEEIPWLKKEVNQH